MSDGENLNAHEFIKKSPSYTWLKILIVILVLAGIGVGLYFLLIKQDTQSNINKLKKSLKLTLEKYSYFLVLVGNSEAIKNDIECKNQRTNLFTPGDFIILNKDYSPFVLTDKEMELIESINKIVGDPNLDINRQNNGQCDGIWLGTARVALLRKDKPISQELKSLGYGQEKLYDIDLYMYKKEPQEPQDPEE